MRKEKELARNRAKYLRKKAVFAVNLKDASSSESESSGADD